MDKNIFIGVNGILSNGKRSTDKFLFELETNYECCIEDFYYRRVSLFDVGVRLRKSTSGFFITAIAKRLISTQQGFLNRPVSIIAHSFGCLVVLRALQMGLKAKNVFLFAPAANEEEFINTNNVDHVYVIHNHDDFIIKLGSMLLFHEFGGMGVNGSYQKEDKVTNILYRDNQPLNLVSILKGLFTNHGIYFKDVHIHYWIDFISNICELKRRRFNNDIPSANN